MLFSIIKLIGDLIIQALLPDIFRTGSRSKAVAPLITKVGRATLKMLHRKRKKQFLKQERNTQNAIALFNYLKRIAPQQLMLRMQLQLMK